MTRPATTAPVTIPPATARPATTAPATARPRRLSYFIAGTDTEIGKTLASCGLLHAFAAHGYATAAMKPIAAGAEQDADGEWRNEDVEALAANVTVSVPRALSTPYLLHEPAAPHLVARQAGVTMDMDYIVQCHRAVIQHADVTIVEGVGGFRVPLNDDQDTGDLAVALDLPVILVVGMRLGCLSHALLTAQAIVRGGLRLAGWIANTVDPSMRLLPQNIDTLRDRLARHHGAPLLGTIPRLADPTGAQAALWLDAALLLADPSQGRWP
ncbi:MULTISPECIES: dethiobiotin synthase [unclassified Achromobacter]|uniref:dethiobiotin synthase n=1 Tax=unclassified Achromobacter TaxID=2626865 RepID=UPI000B515738|nr:dethiobiotin synthase [Achromobacter sp. HZ34]OWT71827.1 dethiobiotin synthase [Achromobacter sp. HZ28]